MQVQDIESQSNQKTKHKFRTKNDLEPPFPAINWLDLR